MRPAIALAAVLAILPGVASSETRYDGQKTSRFTLRASLEAQPKTIGDSRFGLRGQFSREKDTPTQQAHGYALSASLALDGAGQCGTQLIFANGFE